MTALEVLRTTRKLLSNPKRWAKGRLFAPKNSSSTGEDSYCLLGALGESAGMPAANWALQNFYLTEGCNTEAPKQYEDAVFIMAEAITGHRVIERREAAEGVYIFNDEATFEQLMEAIDKACQIAFDREQAMSLEQQRLLDDVAQIIRETQPEAAA